MEISATIKAGEAGELKFIRRDVLEFKDKMAAKHQFDAAAAVARTNVQVFGEPPQAPDNIVEILVGNTTLKVNYDELRSAVDHIAISYGTGYGNWSR